MKMSGAKRSCEHISKLIGGENMLQIKTSFNDIISHKMMIQLDVFSSRMENWIMTEKFNTKIVTQDERNG